MAGQHKNFEDYFEELCLKENFPSEKKKATDVIETLLQTFEEVPGVHVESAERFLDWARQHKKLKVVSVAVPPGILLPVGFSGTLHDIKVNPRRGPDDALYDASKELRAKVARGNCLLELSGGKKEERLQCVVYAMKKFTGGLGDDDDRDKGDNHTWKKYFTRPLSEAQSVVCTMKANGEAAHLSAVKVSGETYVCTGSKNVHLIIRRKEDIELYSGDRFRIAKEVAHTVMDLLESMAEKTRNRLLRFLCLSRYTGMFEILAPDHQHVVNLSALTKPELKFIAWTSNDLEPKEGRDLCVMAPHTAIELCRSFGLPSVDYEVIKPDDVNEQMAQIRRDYNSEGKVLYFLDHDSKVIGLLKKKTIWYIICRAIREKVKTASGIYSKSPATFSEGQAIKKIEKRISEIQTWLGLDEESKEAWAELGTKFLKWCIYELKEGSVSHHDIAELFPVTWQRFLTESGSTDQINVRWTEPEGSDD